VDLHVRDIGKELRGVGFEFPDKEVKDDDGNALEEDDPRVGGRDNTDAKEVEDDGEIEREEHGKADKERAAVDEKRIEEDPGEAFAAPDKARLFEGGDVLPDARAGRARGPERVGYEERDEIEHKQKEARRDEDEEVHRAPDEVDDVGDDRKGEDNDGCLPLGAGGVQGALALCFLAELIADDPVDGGKRTQRCGGVLFFHG